ncbi:MAG: hypothetical protein LUE20_04220 [Oscillospiraceae bacterium]|nr:hypothetical protein [Oscillospiraceae bacterium]
MKRFLSILTALVLCVCMFTTTLSATEPISSSGLTKDLEVTKTVASKLYTYTDGDTDSIGVYVYQGGSISFGKNNKTNTYSSVKNYAYGVYIEDGGSVIMIGGTYSSNNCGVYVGGSGSTLAISGATNISGNSYTSGNETVNCNVYLDDGALITLSGELTSGASIGVTTNTKPTQDNPVQITTAETSTTKYYETALNYFFSDDPDYEIRINETGGYLELCVPTEYSVTADQDIANGSVTVSATSARSGATITVTPEAAEGYEIVSVTYTYNNGTDDVTTEIPLSNGVYSFTMPAYDVTVSATFTKTVVVTEPIDSSGLSAQYAIGGNLGSAYGSLTITSNDYNMIGVYEYGSGNVSFGDLCTVSGYVYGIYATGNSTLTITGGSYTDNYVGIYIGSNATINLSGSPVISGNAYTSGTDTVDCNLYLDDGALIVLGQLTDGASISVTTTVKPTAGNPVQITTAEAGGSTEYYKTALQYFSSDDPNYVVRINEEGGYLELCVADNDVTIDQDIENGSVTVDPESAAEGDTVTVTLTADVGYEVDTVTYTYNNGTDDVTTEIPLSNGVYSFTMPDYEVTVSATFKKSVYSIAVSSGANGTVTVDPENASMGDTVTITATGDRLYAVESVTVLDESGSPVTVIDNGNGTYSFTMPAGAVTISVSFYQYASSVSGTIYVNEQYHGIFINGRLVCIPHTVDENGYCTVCKEYIGLDTEEVTEIVEETVEVDEPVEGTDLEVEADD